MTYSLNTLNSSSPVKTPERSGATRFVHEVGLILGLLAIVFWLLALLSYSPQDAAWSTSGYGGPVRNLGGRLGAWIADASYFLLGFSAWWCFAAAVRAWLAALARGLRGDDPAAIVASAPHDASGWAGLPPAARRSGALWRCCCARARRWNGRACTVSRATCRARPAACWVIWSDPPA